MPSSLSSRPLTSRPLTSRPLTSRQETFARQFCATGNAAEAARRAGYAAGSARQTGHDLLDRPWVIERIRAIREQWRRVAQDEAAILLVRLEQAWDVAVAGNDGRGSASQMLQVIRLQAEIAGLTRKGAAARADLWNAPGDASGDASGDAPGEAAEEGAGGASPLAAAVRQGRDSAERMLADHRRQYRARRADPAFDATAHLETQSRLDRAIAARRALLRRTLLHPTLLDRAKQHDSLTDHDRSLHSNIGAEAGIGADAREAIQAGDDARVDAAEAGFLAQTRAQGQGDAGSNGL